MTHFIRNNSLHPQRAWADVGIPISEAEPLPPVFYDANGRLCVKGAAVGLHTRMLHVRCVMEGFESAELDLSAVEAAEHTHAMSDWLLDDVAGLFPSVFVRRGDQWHGSPWATPKLVDHCAALQTYHVRDRVGASGFVFDCYLRCYSGQDVVEFSGALTWSDPSTSDIEAEFDEIRIECGEGLHLDNALALGFHQDPDNPKSWFLPAGKIADGQMIAFHGAILCQPDPEPSVAHHVARGDFGALARLANLAARVAGRIEALGAFDGHWLCFGQTPATAPTDTEEFIQLLAQADGLLSTGGDYWNSRPLGLRKEPGGTGDQEDFGASKSVALTTLQRVELLPFARYAISEPMRPIHFREADGSPFRVESHPQFVSWSQRAHHNWGVSPDRLGKVEPRPWPPELHGWLGKDNQHNSTNRLAELYALTGDPLLGLLIRDEAEHFLARDPASIDSPRGQGRSLHSAALCYLLTGDERIWTRIVQMVDTAAASLEPADPTAPVRVLGTITDPRGLKDPDTGQPWACVSVWEHGLALLGYCAVLATARRTGKEPTPAMVDVPRILAATILAIGLDTDGAPLNQVRWLGGAKLPPEKRGAPGWTSKGGMDPAWVFAGLHAFASVFNWAIGPVTTDSEDGRLLDAARKALLADQHANTWRDREWRASGRVS